MGGRERGMKTNIIIESDHDLDNKEIARELLDKACANIAMSDLDLMDGQHFKYVIKGLIAELDRISSLTESEKAKRAEANKIKSEWTIMDW
jgi:hypothetical protein